MRETTFIYALVEADTREPRYVGKANEPQVRFARHLREAKKGVDLPCLRWLRKRIAQARLPELVKLMEVPITEWEFWERQTIAHFRVVFPRLLNVAAGGDGPPAGHGEKNPMFGKKHSPETKLKMRAAQVGKKQTPTAIAARQGIRHKTGSSEYVGVSLCRRKWVARAAANGQSHYLGIFQTEEDAARAYNTAALSLYGPNARVNFKTN